MRRIAVDTINSAQAGFDLFDDDSRDDDRRHNASFADASDYIVDIREYDVPYHVRVMIDMGEFWLQAFLSSSLTGPGLTRKSRYPGGKVVFRGG